MNASKRFGFLLVFLVPALMPLSAWAITHSNSPNLMAWLPLFVLFGVLPAVDYAVGRDTANPDEAESERLEQQPWFRWLTWACLPVQFATLIFSAWMFVELPLGKIGLIGWLISQGVVGGILAINVAHELIHKSGSLEPALGGLLLCSVNYFGFKIEHVRGHHVHVATAQDASSAKFGESVYPFVIKAFLLNSRNAWRLEADRLRKLGLPAWHWRNEMLLWSAISAAMAIGFAAALGPWGLAFYVVQGLLAAWTLEVINYIEHYGLERRELGNGRFERVTHLHSWNSNYLISNLILFQLQRHSDHHETARRRYQALRHHHDSPQLPGGYAAMFLLALVPPLWRRLIDPRVLVFRNNALS